MTAIRHLYLHVPFCRSRSPYCDFAVTAESPADLEGWLEAIARELDCRGGRDQLLGSLRTLHVGGGTPSILGVALAEGLRRLLGSVLGPALEEWSVEANPEDLDAATLAGWRRHGVSRVSVGVQSLHPPALEFLGRIHDAETGEAALRRVAGEGFASWGVDVLFGLPLSVDPRPHDSLERILETNPPHVSLYELVVEEETALAGNLAIGRPDGLADEDLRADQYLELGALLESAGYGAYEMTAFAKPGHESAHWTGVLSGEPHLGLGPGAVSRIGGRVRRNTRNWLEYARDMASAPPSGDPGAPGSRAGREEAVESRDEDALVLLHDRLRLREGIPLRELSSGGRAVADRWAGLGLAVPVAGRLRLTPSGWLRLDSLAIELFGAEADSGEPDKNRHGREKR